MSCRVAGKFVESALFAHLLKTENCASGKFGVVKTKKNVLLRNTLEQIGFVRNAEQENSCIYSFSRDLVHCSVVKVCEE